MATENGNEEVGFEQAKVKARDSFKGLELRELVLLMAERRRSKDEAEAVLSAINAEYDVLRFEAIPECMDKAGIDRIQYEGIGRVSLTADVQVSTKTGAKEALFEWLRGRKLGDLIQPGINASTLKAFVKDRIKQGKDLPTEFLNVTPITRASITKVS